MSFYEARLDSQSIPEAEELPVDNSEAFEKGALLALVLGELEEVNAPSPGDVTYVSQTPFGPNTTGFGAIAGRREFPPGVAVVTKVVPGVTRFFAEYVGIDEYTAIPAPGTAYDVVRSADGKWRVDLADTATGVVRHVGTPHGVVPGLGPHPEIQTRPSVIEVVFEPAANGS